MPNLYSKFKLLPVTLFIFLPLAVFASETYYPDGTLLKGSGSEVFVLENEIGRHITSPEVFSGLNYDWQKIVQVDDSVLKKYPLGQEISDFSRFPDGTLIKGFGPKVYIIKSGRRYWIPDAETFNNIGLRWQNIIIISDERLAKISESKALDVQKSPIKYPETFILGNPAGVFEDTDVNFEFSGQTETGEPSSLTFETFLEGYDKNWNSGWSSKRSFSLPAKIAVYTLFVRAKDKNGNYDPTPASHSFALKVSPYFKKVRIEGGNIKKSKAEEEFLSVYNSTNDTINVAGWTLVAKRGDRSYSIPDGYDNAGLGYQNNFNILGSSRIYVFTGKTPINWKSFRLNKCTGYFNNDFNFSLTLSNKCPKITSDDLSSTGLSFKCQDFIESLSACEEPENLKIYNLESECQNYIRENINYANCAARHKNETDFFDKTWYVYLGNTSQIWDDKSDTITLRDKDGLKISEYNY